VLVQEKCLNAIKNQVSIYSLVTAFTNAISPSSISTAAPPIEIPFRSKGALLRSQPVTPPNRSIGESAVPKPNRTANPTQPIGVEKGRE